MSGVWMSGVLSNYEIGMKQGARAKFYNHDWNPADLKIPLEPDEVYEAFTRHRKGFALQRFELTEAIAVWDEKRFKKTKDIFTAGPFFAVRGKLASVLTRFDLGEGGLLPLTVYQADLATPMPGECFLLNFGARKNSILIEQCEDVKEFYFDKDTGQQVWHLNDLKEDGCIVLSATALSGPDLWFEEVVYNKIFMTDRLAQALIDIGMEDVFALKRCQIVGEAE